MERLGVEELEKVVLAMASMGNASGLILEDGKFSAADLDDLWSLGLVFRDLSGVDFKKVVPQAKDLEPQEAVQIAASFAKRFDLPQDKVEAKIEVILSFAAQFYVLIGEAMKMIKDLKEVK